MLCRHWFCPGSFWQLQLALDHLGSEWDLLNPQGLCVIEDKLLAVADRGAEPSYKFQPCMRPPCSDATFRPFSFLTSWKAGCGCMTRYDEVLAVFADGHKSKQHIRLLRARTEFLSWRSRAWSASDNCPHMRQMRCHESSVHCRCHASR
jgi:hypothetical protein